MYFGRGKFDYILKSFVISYKNRTTAYRNENSGSDIWYDLGIGTDITLSENSKIWLSSKCIFGGEFDNSWQLNAGIRYSF